MTSEQQAIEDAVEHAWKRQAESGKFAKKDWIQFFGFAILVVGQVMYVTAQWAELKADIAANAKDIERSAADRYTGTQARSDLAVITSRIVQLEKSGVQLETMIRENAARDTELATRMGEVLAELRFLNRALDVLSKGGKENVRSPTVNSP